MRRYLIALLSTMLLLPLSTSAQTGEDWGIWQASMYDFNQGIVYTIDNEGNGEQVRLPAPSGYVDTIPRQVAVSRDGATYAYMTYETLGDGSGTRNGALVVYDRATATRQDYPFVGISNHALDTHASPYIFGPTNTEIALGYRQANGWFIAVLDIVTRSYTDKLLTQANVPLTGALATYTQPVPVVTSYNGRDVEFYVYPAETDDLPTTLNSFVWNTETNEVTPTLRFTNTDFALFPSTGEVALGNALDEVGATPALGALQNNVLDIAPDFQQLQTILTAPTADLIARAFVRNGNGVMFAARIAGEATFELEYPIIERGSGDILRPLAMLRTVNGIQDMAGTEFGVLLTVDSDIAGNEMGLQQLSGTSVVYLDLRDDGAAGYVPVTSIEANRLNIIWTAYDITAPQSAFADWAAPPTLATSGDGVGGGDNQAGSGVLTVGGTATANTTEGDALNIRSGPGTSFAIVDRASNGTTLSLLEGPIDSNGLMWWRVRTPSGVEGWTVQSADGVQTLLPQGGEAAPTGLFVGGSAVISVPANSAANLRQQPTTGATVLLVLRRNDRVAVIGGPIAADGFVWWNVQSTSGVSGWVVESVSTGPVLEPAP
ncbi:MAG: SH3 domain-containing protein [Chloroflexota bacterium]